MRRLILVGICLIASIQASAAPLSVYSTGHEWVKAKNSEKRQVVLEPMAAIKAQYPTMEMVTCLNAFFAPPYKNDILKNELSRIIVLCHMQLN